MKFGERVIRFRWLIVIFTICITGMAAWGAKKLTFSSNYRVFFSKDNPQLEAFDKLQNTYTKNDSVYIALFPKGGKVFSKKTLSAIEELTEAAWQIPHSIRVDSITNFQHSWAEEDDLLVENLVKNVETLSDEQLEAKKEIAINEPFLRDQLISPSAHATGIYVTINLPGKSEAEVPGVAKFANQLADEFRAKHPDIDAHLSGMVMINNSFLEAGEADMATLIPSMYAAILILLAFILPSVTGSIATFLVITFSTLIALGMGGWFNLTLTPISANAPIIILTIAVADSVHIILSMKQEIALGKTKNEAIIESLRMNIKPVVITSVTTAIGFLSLNFADAPPYRDLGNIVATGTLAALITSLTFLPACLAILPFKSKKGGKLKQEYMGILGSFVVKYYRKIFFGMLIFIGTIIIPITQLEISDIFAEYFDERFTYRRDYNKIIKNISGFNMIEYSLEAGEEGGINNPEYLQKLDEFSQWYRKQPTVVNVKAYPDIMKRLNKNLHGDDLDFYKIPGNRELAAQYLLLYEFSLPMGMDLNNMVNVSKSATRFTVVFRNPSTKLILKTEERAQQWLRENAPEYMRSFGSSPTIMFAHITKRNVFSMMGGTFWALLIISGLIGLFSKNLKYGVISLAPNLVPAFMALGLWGLINGKIGLASSVVFAVSLGIVVDDTVHFLSKYLMARKENGMSPKDAVCQSFLWVGPALLVTSLILIVGFSILALSGFEINSQMGTLVAITIFFALCTDFLFLPSLLLMIDREPEKT